MPQTTQNKVGILLPNSSSPIWDSLYPLGDRVENTNWQLASGHFAAQRFPMTVIAPRPDTETGTFAVTASRFRWAYYDGVNPVQYEFPIKVFGGAAPHWFELLLAPSGMTVGNNRTPEDHGVIKWTPAQEYTTSSPATVIVRIYGQDGLYTDATWTIATTSSTDKFLFISNTGSDTTGTGSITAPFATLSTVMGSASTSVTYPRRIVYLRAGNYSTVAHSDAWNGGNTTEVIPARLRLVEGNHPVAYLCYPNEAVNINFSGSQIEVGGNDFYFSGSSTSRLTVSGSSNNAMETHNFWLGEYDRGMFSWVTFDGFIPRVNGNWTNSAPIFSPAGDWEGRQYWGLHDVQEINRVVESDNDALLHVFFSTSYWAEDWCGGTRLANTPGAKYKDTNYNTSVRYGNYRCSGETNAGFSFMGQNDSANCEIVFSRVSGSLFFNEQYTATTNNLHAARCTVYTTDTNYPQALRAWGSGTNFTAENCVLVSTGSPAFSSGVTSIGNECHTTTSSGNVPVNPTSLELVDATTPYRTLYLGTRGWEIV